MGKTKWLSQIPTKSGQKLLTEKVGIKNDSINSEKAISTDHPVNFPNLTRIPQTSEPPRVFICQRLLMLPRTSFSKPQNKSSHPRDSILYCAVCMCKRLCASIRGEQPGVDGEEIKVDRICALIYLLREISGRNPSEREQNPREQWGWKLPNVCGYKP